MSWAEVLQFQGGTEVALPHILPVRTLLETHLSLAGQTNPGRLLQGSLRLGVSLASMAGRAVLSSTRVLRITACQTDLPTTVGNMGTVFIARG